MGWRPRLADIDAQGFKTASGLETSCIRVQIHHDTTISSVTFAKGKAKMAIELVENAEVKLLPRRVETIVAAAMIAYHFGRVIFIALVPSCLSSCRFFAQRAWCHSRPPLVGPGEITRV